MVEAVLRLLSPEPVAGPTVLWVAALGIVINGATALLFMRGRAGDLNVRSAFLHMLGDALVSAAVVVAAGIIMLTGWLWLDPLMSLVVAGVVLVGSWSLGRASVAMALDAVPEGIDAEAVRLYLRELDGVTAVGALRIRPLSTTEAALTAELVRPGQGSPDAVIDQARDELAHRFGIRQSTLQIRSEAGTQGPHTS
jgi:cobalt-zinc-cadmium efflux system protein